MLGLADTAGSPPKASSPSISRSRPPTSSSSSSFAIARNLKRRHPSSSSADSPRSRDRESAAASSSASSDSSNLTPSGAVPTSGPSGIMKMAAPVAPAGVAAANMGVSASPSSSAVALAHGDAEVPPPPPGAPPLPIPGHAFHQVAASVSASASASVPFPRVPTPTDHTAQLFPLSASATAAVGVQATAAGAAAAFAHIPFASPSPVPTPQTVAAVLPPPPVVTDDISDMFVPVTGGRIGEAPPPKKKARLNDGPFKKYPRQLIYQVASYFHNTRPQPSIEDVRRYFDLPYPTVRAWTMKPLEELKKAAEKETSRASLRERALAFYFERCGSVSRAECGQLFGVAKSTMRDWIAHREKTDPAAKAMLTKRPVVKVCEENKADEEKRVEACECFFASRGTDWSISVEKCAKKFGVPKTRMWAWVRADNRYVVTQKTKRYTQAFREEVKSVFFGELDGQMAPLLLKYPSVPRAVLYSWVREDKRMWKKIKKPMTRYSEELKFQVMEAYFAKDAATSTAEVARRFNVPDHTLYGWLKSNDDSKDKKKIQPAYTAEFQREVLEFHFSRKPPSIIETSEKFGVFHKTIRRWVSRTPDGKTVPSRRKMFTPEKKRAAIEAYLADPSRSFEAVAKRHGVPKRSLQTWVRQEKPDSVHHRRTYSVELKKAVCDFYFKRERDIMVTVKQFPDLNKHLVQQWVRQDARCEDHGGQSARKKRRKGPAAKDVGVPPPPPPTSSSSPLPLSGLADAAAAAADSRQTSAAAVAAKSAAISSSAFHKPGTASFSSSSSSHTPESVSASSSGASSSGNLAALSAAASIKQNASSAATASSSKAATASAGDASSEASPPSPPPSSPPPSPPSSPPPPPPPSSIPPLTAAEELHLQNLLRNAPQQRPLLMSSGGALIARHVPSAAAGALQMPPVSLTASFPQASATVLQNAPAQLAQEALGTSVAGSQGARAVAYQSASSSQLAQDLLQNSMLGCPSLPGHQATPGLPSTVATHPVSGDSQTTVSQTVPSSVLQNPVPQSFLHMAASDGGMPPMDHLNYAAMSLIATSGSASTSSTAAAAAEVEGTDLPPGPPPHPPPVPVPYVPPPLLSSLDGAHSAFEGLASPSMFLTMPPIQ